ncbi:MAG: hypothetical protein WA144_15450 [Candidatus Methanoperedens sp.]
MTCTKTIQAQVINTATVTFNGSPRWETVGAMSAIICNVTVSGAGLAGMTLHYVVDGYLTNQDVGITDGTRDVRVSVPVATNVNHTVAIEEASAC